MISLDKWRKTLGINTDSLKTKFKQLKGTRLILQAENQDYVFTMSKTYKPKIETIGITNRCNDGSYIFFADYDQIYKSLVYNDLKLLTKKYSNRFANFFIAITEPETTDHYGNIKGSYHVVCFTKMQKRYIEVALNYCNVDPNYLKLSEKTAHKCHVLRITEKTFKIDGKILKEPPKYLEMYPPTPQMTPTKCSSAHYTALSRAWNFKDPYYGARSWDYQKEIELHKYSSPKVSK